MGQLFRRLIELSPSRADALDRVTLFEQLANVRAYSSFADTSASIPAPASISSAAAGGDAAGDGRVQSSQCPFAPEDVDYIASISFNFGVSRLP
jgi:hypothetical protein